MEDKIERDIEDNLELANQGLIPSPFGRAEYVIWGSPASVQSKKTIRESYLKSIRAQLKDQKYLLTGEIFLNITWLLPAKSRFETDAKADIDNCLKPIIDAFTGIEGLFIDDCQLRALYICWRHIDSDNERVIFDFEFMGDQYSLKEELAFIKLDGGLCCPVNLNWPPEVKRLFSDMLEHCSKAKGELENMGVSYLFTSGLLAGNQPFHISRVKNFELLSLADFCESGVHT